MAESSYARWKREREAARTLAYECCACARPFDHDGAPEANAPFPAAITCPHCSFRQGKTWALPGQVRSKEYIPGGPR